MFSPGDPVMFILTTITATPRLLMGKARELTQYSVVIDYIPVAYLPPISGNRSKGFQFGTAELVKGKYWEINGTRRTPDRIVVINWEKRSDRGETV